MKVSVVVTVLNEEGVVGSLMEGILTQERRPEEVLVVDGGSADGTVRELGKWREKMEKRGVRVKIWVKTGYNIAKGRNWGIGKAEGEVIAVTDGGCVPERRWLERIVVPIEKGRADVVAGFYQMEGESSLQKVLASYLGVVRVRLEEKRFLPSSRSVAFTFAIWEKAGGYPEGLRRTGEDTVFNLRLIKVGARFETVKGAVVRWRLPDGLREAAWKFFEYARGDGEAGIWWHPWQKGRTHLIKIGLVFLRYGVLGFMFWLAWWWGFLGVVGYGVWAMVKNRDVVFGRATWWCLVVQVTSDFCVMAGAVVGLWSRSKSRLGKGCLR